MAKVVRPKSPITPAREIGVLGSIAASVGQSLDLDTVLETALTKVMELMGVEHGGIYLVDRSTQRLALRTQYGLTEGFRREKSLVDWGDGCAGEAAATGNIWAAFDHAEKVFVCADSERLMGIDCLVAAPLKSKGRVLGVLELFAPVSRRLTAAEGEVLAMVGNQIGVAIDNAQLYEESREHVRKLTHLERQLREANRQLQNRLEQESHIAKTLQRSLLPRQLVCPAGFQLAMRHLSATQAASVGGDFYDVFTLPDGRVALVVGDACGSGIEAATLMSVAKHTVRAFAHEHAEPASVLSRTNRALCWQVDPSRFVTLFLATLDPKTGTLVYANAGHPVPIVARRLPQPAALTLEGGDMALAVHADAKYRPHKFQLSEGDTLAIFTDGLVEARQGQALFGEDHIQRLLLDHIGEAAEDVVEELLLAAKVFAGGNFLDDVAVMVLQKS